MSALKLAPASEGLKREPELVLSFSYERIIADQLKGRLSFSISPDGYELFG